MRVLAGISNTQLYSQAYSKGQKCYESLGYGAIKWKML